MLTPEESAKGVRNFVGTVFLAGIALGAILIAFLAFVLGVLLR